MFNIDGLQCAKPTQSAIDDWRRAELGAVNVTVSFWEGAAATLRQVGAWERLARKNHDSLSIIKNAFQLEEASRNDRTGVILGTQNSACFEDDIELVYPLRAAGLTIVQLTYNNQNAVASGCFENVDAGLSRFGRELVEEMNGAGITIDLSHVGNRSSLEAINHSSGPVIISHSNPTEMYDHPRNKTTEVLKELASRGGVLGVSPYRHIAGRFTESVEDTVELISKTVDLIGIESVGVGTDLAPEFTTDDMTWLRKGKWSRVHQGGAALKEVPPQWLESSSDLKVLRDALISKGGFSAEETEKVMGGNLLRVFRETW